ncbi:MAG: hypothetical protein V3V10_00025 [Planctomycetota bacterium]
MTKLLPLLIFSLLASGLMAEKFSYDKPKFTCTIPEGFERFDTGDTDKICDYWNEENALYCGIVHAGEVIQPNELDGAVLVDGADIFDHYYVEWKGNKLNVSVFYERGVDEAGTPYTDIVYNCWIPLKEEAIILVVSGERNSDRSELRSYMQSFVNSVEGEHAPMTSGVSAAIGFGVILVMGLVIVFSVVLSNRKRKRQSMMVQNFGMPQPPLPGAPQQQYQNRPNYPNQQPPG